MRTHTGMVHFSVILVSFLFHFNGKDLAIVIKISSTSRKLVTLYYE